MSEKNLILEMLQDDEIDLREMIKAIIKRKKLKRGR